MKTPNLIGVTSMVTVSVYPFRSPARPVKVIEVSEWYRASNARRSPKTFLYT
jgi:hypothetical protein